jgi:hypothetical protein
MLSMVLGYLMFKENIFTVKGGPNLGPHQQVASDKFAYHLNFN